MNIIAAVDQNWGIGNQGKLLISLKRDMAFFRKKTLHQTIILGRKTLQSFPGGKPLTDREHIVFSQSMTPRPDIMLVRDIDDLKALKIPLDEAFVIGGETIYRLLIPYCKTAFITKIFRSFKADAFFPNLDEMSNWVLSDIIERFEEDGTKAEIAVYQNTEILPL